MRKIENELRHEEAVDTEIVKDIHGALKKITKLFRKAEHLFKIHETEATLHEIEIELEEKEQEFRHIIEKLLQFFHAYEKIFEKELEELEKN